MLTLYSACNGPITVDTVRVTGTAAALLTASLMPEAPLDVPKGGAFQVGFQYDARLAYGQSAQLEIDVAGFEGPLRVIPLVLQKPLPPIQTDVFAATGQLTFSLSHPVALDEPEPVVVTIDGQPFPKFDAQGMERWTYSAAQNTVTFAALAAPNAGAIVAISYKSTCP